jgi:DNA-binding CsgD family transcriptional regulator
MVIALQAGIDQEQSVGLMIHGLVQAHLGNLEDAHAAAQSALGITNETRDRVVAIRCLGVLGFVELSRGDPGAAVDHLSRASEELRELGVGELSISQVVNNEIEALVSLERLEQAEELIGYVEAKGQPTGRAWHTAVAARGRALVAASRGEADSARDHLARALSAHEHLPQPFELGRTLLAQGTIERRFKRRADARHALTAALELFDSIGAPLWAEKAAVQLARIPGRRSSPLLSETERRVAEQVVAGLSNKEIAARLFVTVRTVETHLTSVYAKLGVRSRTELASHLARGDDS